ncbi:MAG: serine hydrolase domain-containing protein [Planctomycetota bacterium]|nr:serine hydrolase domain-containing protein [Planctomycetota bacterium]
MVRLPWGSLSLCLVGLVVSGMAAELPVGDQAAARFASGTLEGAADHLQQEVASKNIAGGMHLVLHAGKVVHFAVAGVADIEEGGRLEKDALMRIFSMSKPITSVAAMQLWEQGKFRLDDPVARFIPSFADIKVRVTSNGKTQLVPPLRPISVRDLLRHTSGFSYGNGHGDQVLQDHRRAGVLYGGVKDMFPPAMTIAHAVDALARIPLLHHPGERFTYGFNTDVLGRLIEVWSEERLDHYMQKDIFDPLAMRDTGFFVPGEKAARFASCHAVEAGKVVVVDRVSPHNPYVRGMKFLSGGGGLVSTMEDYARFCLMMMAGGELNGQRVLKPATVATMFSDHLDPALDHARWGLGFEIKPIKLGSGEMVTGYRWGGYANTNFVIIPERQLIQIFMRQNVPSTHRVSRQLFQRIYQGMQ